MSSMLMAARQHSQRRALRLLLLEALMMQHAIAAFLDGSSDLHALNSMLAAHEMQLEVGKAPAAAKDRHAQHKHKRKRRSFDWLEEDDLASEHSNAEQYTLSYNGGVLHEGPGRFLSDAARTQVLQTWMRKLFKWH